MDDGKCAELTPSKLGRKDQAQGFTFDLARTQLRVHVDSTFWCFTLLSWNYEPSENWDAHYALEHKNFSDHDYDGDVWFGERTERIVVEYICKNIAKNCRIIDLGCGNGSLLRLLQKQDFSSLYGVDYSEDAVKLSIDICRGKSDASHPQISFRTIDLLHDALTGQQYGAAIDKGTWDAMSSSNEQEKRLQIYKSAVCNILEQSGLFIIVSCNFTFDELKHQFQCSNMKLIDEIRTSEPIEFGGKSGFTSSAAVFTKL